MTSTMKNFLDTFAFGKLGAELNKNLRNSKVSISSYETEDLMLWTYSPNQDHGEGRTAVGDPSVSRTNVSVESLVEFWVSR